MIETQSVKLDSIQEDLNHPDFLALKRTLIEEALTLVRNKDMLLPFRKIDTLDIASLSIGADAITPFQQSLSKYVDMPHHQTDREISQK